MTLTATEIEVRLQEIDEDLAARGPAYAAAAEAWYRILRDREHKHAIEFMKASGTPTERKEKAKRETALIGLHEEAVYEGLKAAVRVLETRATIGMSLLRSARSAP